MPPEGGLTTQPIDSKISPKNLAGYTWCAESHFPPWPPPFFAGACARHACASDRTRVHSASVREELEFRYPRLPAAC